MSGVFFFPFAFVALTDDELFSYFSRILSTKIAVVTPLHSGRSAMSIRSATTSIAPAQYMREEMLTPSPPPNWASSFAGHFESRAGTMEFKDEVCYV